MGEDVGDGLMPGCAGMPGCADMLGGADVAAGPTVGRGVTAPGEAFGKLSTVEGTKGALSPATRWSDSSPAEGMVGEAGWAWPESGTEPATLAGAVAAGIGGAIGRPGVHGAKALEAAAVPAG